mmetsp:Transcript_63867/g.74275  ORF Transcript_63867/g.74275 Transcript_63867/m.74275 type:complete len:106 (+) Transcript_63867:30-347(+)
MSEVEETIGRIKTHGSVEGLIIVNNEENIIRNTLGPERKELSETIVRTIPPLAKKARSVIRDLDPNNNLTFLRMRSKNIEIMVAPDESYMLIVVQRTGEAKKEDS